MPDLNAMRKDIVSYSVSDSATRQIIIDFYQKFNKIIEPHGAVGWAALQQYRKNFPKSNKIKAICFETADPAKFPEEIRSLINIEPLIPHSLQEIRSKENILPQIEIVNYEDFKEFLHNKYIE